MRLLHCIPGMGGGGAERQLAYLARPLIELGWEVHTALVAGGPNLRRLQQSGSAVHRLTSSNSYDPRVAWQLGRLIRRVKPDLVQTWFVQMDVIAGASATFGGIPWILSERSSKLAYPRTLKNRLRVAIARRADAVISNSSGGDAYWAERLPDRILRFIIPNAVPLDEIHSAIAGVPAELSIAADVSVVLCVGRFGLEKNLDRTLEALSEIVRRPGTVAVFCGDGPLRPEISRRIMGRGLAHAILTPGYISNLWPLLKRADVVVAGGLFEGRPNAVIEAMAAGRPLVVSDIPAHREILDEASAVWVEAADALSIAEGIRNVLDDPVAAERRAAAATSRTLPWSVQAAAAEYDRAYRAVLSRSSASRRQAGRRRPETG